MTTEPEPSAARQRARPTGAARVDLGPATLRIVDAFAQELAASGCQRAYGLAGEDHVELLAALDRAGIRYVRAYHESAAVLMAAGEAQATGGCGIAIVSMSAGMSNAVNGLTHALMEQLPIIIISGQHPAAQRPFIVRQGFDVAALAAPVTKWGVALAAGSNVGQLVAKALRVALAWPQGPVYIELPAEVGSAEVAAVPCWGPRSHGGASPHPPPAPRELESSELDRLRGILLAARHPVVVVGGRQHLHLRESLELLSQRWRMPVFLTSNQKGLLDPVSPFLAGTFLNSNPERQLIDQADLLLAVNLEAFDIYSRALNLPAAVVSVSTHPIDEMFVPFAEEFVVDPCDALERLAAVAPPDAPSEWSAGDVSAHRRQVAADLARLDRVPGALTTTSVIDVLAGLLPGDATVVADAGFSKPIVAHLWPSSRPGAFIASNAFGTMGHALPTAIAFALADPGRTTIAMMGDGSLLMRVSELRVASDVGADVLIIAFLDESFTQISVKQERRGLPRVGVTLPPLSAQALGAAFGCSGVDVHTAGELRDAVVSVQAQGGPALVGVHVDNRNANPVFGYLRG